MGLQHLAGKRTGRPKGSRSKPRWLRDLAWAEKNLGNPDAQPPSELARRLRDLGRARPDQFLACLALRDVMRRAGKEGYHHAEPLRFPIDAFAYASPELMRQLQRYQGDLPWFCKIEHVNDRGGLVALFLVPPGGEG
jgi:hypothetical protein